MRKVAANDIFLPEKVTSEVVQVEEMWHFVNGKTCAHMEKFGSEDRFTDYHVDLLGGTSVTLLTKI